MGIPFEKQLASIINSECFGVIYEFWTSWKIDIIFGRYLDQRYTHRVLQTIQMKLMLLCVWAELAILGCAKTPLEFKYEI